MGWVFAAITVSWLIGGPAWFARKARRADWPRLRLLLRRLPFFNALFAGASAAIAAYFLVIPGLLRPAAVGVALILATLLGQSLTSGKLYRHYIRLRGPMPLSDFRRRLLASGALWCTPPGLTCVVLSSAKWVFASNELQAYLALALAFALWLYQWSFLRALTLPGRPAPFPSKALLEDAKALARRMNAPFDELLLIRVHGSRCAGAFALDSGRIAITDYFLSALDREEFLAVVAHELQHFRQRTKTAAYGLTGLLICAVGGAFFAYGAATGTAPRFLCLAGAFSMACLSFLPLAKLRARNEDEADKAAIVEVGARPLMNALVKAAELNGNSQAGAVHRSLESRLRQIASSAGLDPPIPAGILGTKA